MYGASIKNFDPPEGTKKFRMDEYTNTIQG
jgi:hypothetical protein